MTTSEENSPSSEFSLLLSKTLNHSGPELLFSIAFVFTVETGFIPISLENHFESVNSNIELAKMINSLPLNSFWHQNNNIFTAHLLMSNQLCYLTGIPVTHGDSLIATLSYSNVSKCTLLEANNINLYKKPVSFSQLSLKFKNLVSVPIKCSVLDITTGQYPGLCGLPEELILYIMSTLKASDLYALMRCCKKMYYLAANSQYLWKRFLKAEFEVEGELVHTSFTDWKKYYFSLKKDKYDRKKRLLSYFPGCSC